MSTWTFADSLTLTVAGLLIVFLVQASISLVVALMRRLDENWRRKEEMRATAAFGKEPTVDATTLVLIAAAVGTVLTGRHRIRSVRRLLPADAPSSPWSSQGRAVLQGSHVIVRKGTRA